MCAYLTTTGEYACTHVITAGIGRLSWLCHVICAYDRLDISRLDGTHRSHAKTRMGLLMPAIKTSVASASFHLMPPAMSILSLHFYWPSLLALLAHV